MPPSTVRWREYDIPIPPLDLGDPEILHRHAFFARAVSYLTFNEISGDYAEFGCASAKTFRMAHDAFGGAENTARMLWAFDGFEGLPPASDPRDEHPKWTLGNYPTPLDLFDALVEAHGISRDRYRTVPGMYAETIGPRVPDDPELAPRIALAYIDCDMYSSTNDVLHFLSNRLHHGMVIAFDDYFCYSESSIAGERLAFLEFLAAHPRYEFVPYGQIGWHGQAFIVEDTSLRWTRAPA